MKLQIKWLAAGMALSMALSAGATGERKLVWSDEFNGTELDTKRWNRHMSKRPDLVELKDGALTGSATTSRRI